MDLQSFSHTPDTKTTGAFRYFDWKTNVEGSFLLPQLAAAEQNESGGAKQRLRRPERLDRIVDSYRHSPQHGYSCGARDASGCENSSRIGGICMAARQYAFFGGPQARIGL